jgi:hypothetical protein
MERTGEIPVRITLIWDFKPGGPARWLRMNTNRHATDARILHHPK